MLDSLATIESNVRGYARLFPTVFDTASGSILCDSDGTKYIDFFCGAGSLNYGHNPQRVKQALIDYISRDGIQHSLDTVTDAKVKFVESFQETILWPRELDYRLQFTGPTGTNAVEAAIKLARKQTNRSHIVAFTRGYHGHTLGSLSLTANQYYHSETFGSHNNVSHLPFDGYFGQADTSMMLKKMLDDPCSGLPKPAAIILETVQGEGGINVASDRWLRQVATIAAEHDIRLIVDDIQVGNGRTGTFFSFERSGIVPDLVCLSKSIGNGLPLSLVLIKPECDVWNPGEHTGTFRGNNLAFVAAATVLEHWKDARFENEIAYRGELIQDYLKRIVNQHRDNDFELRGRGLIWGIDVRCGKLARRIIDESFATGLLLEASGSEDQVLKVMPALTIPPDTLRDGLNRLADAFNSVLGTPAPIVVPRIDALPISATLIANSSS